MPPSKQDFRQIMGQFATGVTIVTTRHSDKLHGSTANAVTSVSLDPMMVLVCMEHTTDTYPILRESGVFALNILSVEQEHLSTRFASKDTEDAHNVQTIPHRFAATGAPIIEGSLAYLDCRTVEILPGGDHFIFLGQVEEAGIMNEDEPLLFFRGRYAQLKK